MPPLPVELRAEILSLVSKHKVKLPIWKRGPDANHLVIFVLFDTTATELARMQDAIEKSIPSAFKPEELLKYPFRDLDLLYNGLPSFTVELIPWERHRISSRRDLFRVWDEYQLWDGPWKSFEKTVIFPLLYLMEPFEDMESTRFGVLGRSTELSRRVFSVVPTAVNRRLKLGGICRTFHRTKNIPLEDFDHMNFTHEYWGEFDGEERVVTQMSPSIPFTQAKHQEQTLAAVRYLRFSYSQFHLS